MYTYNSKRSVCSTMRRSFLSNANIPRMLVSSRRLPVGLAFTDRSSSSSISRRFRHRSAQQRIQRILRRIRKTRRVAQVKQRQSQDNTLRLKKIKEINYATTINTLQILHCTYLCLLYDLVHNFKT